MDVDQQVHGTHVPVYSGELGVGSMHGADANRITLHT